MKKFVDCSPQWLKQVLESLASSSKNLLVIAGHDWIDGRYAARLFGYGKMTAKMQAKCEMFLAEMEVFLGTPSSI